MSASVADKTQITYIPSPTVEKFMLDDENLVRCIVGPLGSGKSMGCIMELLRRSTQQAPHNGVRYSRWAIIRNTLQQLRSTVLSDIQQYISPMIRYFVTDSTIQLRVPLPDGTTLHSDWILIPLDTKEDVKRLLSLQLTGAWINEVREVPFEIILPLLGRLGRYPSKANGGFTWRGLIMDTNPWDVDSRYHEALVLAPRPLWKLYHQPSGIGPDAENVDKLPAGYYENLMSDRDTGWQEVHVESQFGESNSGQAVFRKSFHAPTHVRDLQMIVNPNRPLIVAVDFGRTPTALIGQMDNYGRLIIYREVCTEDMGLHQMLDQELKPVLWQEPFAGRRSFVVADPAGRDKGQLTEETPFDALKEHGFIAYPASTNKLEPRLRAVEKRLRMTIMGQPGVQISREGCPTLVKALGARYRYRKKRDGQLEEGPDKSHPWSDVADCLQYMCLGADMNLSGRVMQRDMKRSVNDRPKVTAAGWT